MAKYDVYTNTALTCVNILFTYTGGPPKPEGHAVVLTACNPKCLKFMSSWGQEFADKGFFRVKDHEVLNETKFYDVYWTLDDLKPNEIDAYSREGAKRGQELLQTFPSIRDLSYECPKCYQYSDVGTFSGDLLEAECPRCCQKFKPTIGDIIYKTLMNSRKY